MTTQTDKTINNGIEYIPQNTTDPAIGLNNALNDIDVLLQSRVQDVNITTPPQEPKDGDCYIIGASLDPIFKDQNGKLARYLDQNWSFYNAYLVVNLKDNSLYLNGTNGWVKV